VPIGLEPKDAREMRKIRGFRREGRGAIDAGKSDPSIDAGMAPQECEAGLLVSFARGTRHAGLIVGSS